MQETGQQQNGIATPVTVVLALICIIFTIPGIFSTVYYEYFSAEIPQEYWWQRYTGVFQHGHVDRPIAIVIHLAGNLFLLFMVGVPCEKLLGTARFIILTLSAWLGFIIVCWLTGVWVNGSSGIIWAYSPFLLYFIKHPDDSLSPGMARGILLFMWLIVTFIMGFIPQLFNDAHSYSHTFLFGNLIHAVGTAIGFIYYFLWVKSLLIKK